MQAILTKYLGPTDHRGARVKAQGARSSVTVDWDCALSTDDNHRAAAKAYALKMGWTPDKAPIYGATWHEAAMPESSPWANVYVLPMSPEGAPRPFGFRVAD